MKFSCTKIASNIYNDFIKNNLQEEEALPTEQELSLRYKASRTTIRKAIKELINSNYVYSIQGSGTYVKKNKIREIKEHKVTVFDDFTAYAKKLGKKPSTQVLEFSIIKANFKISELLGIEAEEMIYYIRRVRFLDSLAVNHEISYMPINLFPALSIAVMEQSKYEYIEHELDLKIQGNYATFSPIILDENLAKLFDHKPKSLGLCIKIQSYLSNGICFEYTESVRRNPDDYVIAIESNRN